MAQSRRGLQVGTLDQRVTFQEAVLVDDGQGGQIASGWANIATTPTMWAKVIHNYGRENDEGDNRAANVNNITVTIRNRAGIDETMRLVWRGLPYNIRVLDPYNPRAPERTLQCDGGVPT